MRSIKLPFSWWFELGNTTELMGQCKVATEGRWIIWRTVRARLHGKQGNFFKWWERKKLFWGEDTESPKKIILRNKN
jgi:hypothetical protein